MNMNVMSEDFVQEELHVCKDCGEKMKAELIIFHKDSTGHSEFKPVFDDLEMKGGLER